MQSRAKYELAKKSEVLAEYKRRFRRLFGSDEGKRVLEFIVNNICDKDGDLLHQEDRITAYRIGKRDVARSILSLLENEETNEVEVIKK